MICFTIRIKSTHHIILPKDTKIKIRTTLYIECCGYILVPILERGTHSTFIAPLFLDTSPVFTLLESSLGPIKIPQMYMSPAFLIFLLVSLILPTDTLLCEEIWTIENKFIGTYNIFNTILFTISGKKLFLPQVYSRYSQVNQFDSFHCAWIAFTCVLFYAISYSPK